MAAPITGGTLLAATVHVCDRTASCFEHDHPQTEAYFQTCPKNIRVTRVRDFDKNDQNLNQFLANLFVSQCWWINCDCFDRSEWPITAMTKMETTMSKPRSTPPEQKTIGSRFKLYVSKKCAAVFQCISFYCTFIEIDWSSCQNWHC